MQRSGGGECQAKGAAGAKALRQKWLGVFQEQKDQKAVGHEVTREPHRMMWERQAEASLKTLYRCIRVKNLAFVIT